MDSYLSDKLPFYVSHNAESQHFLCVLCISFEWIAARSAAIFCRTKEVVLMGKLFQEISLAVEAEKSGHL